jgi:hypothetical protein
VAGHLGTAIADAKAYEEERKRAEALAQLDRAKTKFFSNVSHEFRTPLTLMLSPLEDALEAPSHTLSGAALDMTYRNALRLLKLVNTLLDFSRIEAGRVQASFEPVDLARLTSELASVFRSTIERAGLTLNVACGPVAEPVYVDRELWEKIVMNLLSNAFKFTFQGEIGVRLRRVADRVVLEVSDTGTGISQEELPRVFERFHRIEGARARTHEGSGIGLALVQELVRLHGGEIYVESELGRGTTFTIALRLGAGHLPADRLGAPRPSTSTSIRTAAFVDEAMQWLSADEVAPQPTSQEEVDRDRDVRILLADDNADMREYVARLLRERWTVEAVGDGLAALTAARARRPALVLTDVMMPGLDGFELLRELRNDPATRTSAARSRQNVRRSPTCSGKPRCPSPSCAARTSYLNSPILPISKWCMDARSSANRCARHYLSFEIKGSRINCAASCTPEFQTLAARRRSSWFVMAGSSIRIGRSSMRPCRATTATTTASSPSATR